MFNKKSKTQKIIEYLEKKGSITSWEAITRFKYTRLSDIIFVLRRKGWIIDSEHKQNKDSVWVQYNLIKKVD